MICKKERRIALFDDIHANKLRDAYRLRYLASFVVFGRRIANIPLLLQWIKKTMENVSFSIVFLVQGTGLEPAC